MPGGARAQWRLRRRWRQSRRRCWPRRLDDEAATQELAAEIAELVGPGDLVTLSGGLGAGKTTFARALIRRLTGDADLEVPSPTFLADAIL